MASDSVARGVEVLEKGFCKLGVVGKLALDASGLARVRLLIALTPVEGLTDDAVSFKDRAEEGSSGFWHVHEIEAVPRVRVAVVGKLQVVLFVWWVV